jgi:hypothetical protein
MGVVLFIPGVPFGSLRLAKTAPQARKLRSFAAATIGRLQTNVIDENVMFLTRFQLAILWARSWGHSISVGIADRPSRCYVPRPSLQMEMGVAILIPGVPFGSLRLAKTAPQARKLRSFAATTIGRLQTNVTDENVMFLTRFQLAILWARSWGHSIFVGIADRPSRCYVPRPYVPRASLQMEMGVAILIPGVPFGSLRLAKTAPQAKKLRSFAATTIGRLQTNVTDENVMFLTRFQLAILRARTWGHSIFVGIADRPSRCYVPRPSLQMEMGVAILIPGVPFGSLRLAKTAPQARKLRSFAATTIGRLQTNVTDENVMFLTRFQLAILWARSWGHSIFVGIADRPSRCYVPRAVTLTWGTKGARLPSCRNCASPQVVETIGCAGCNMALAAWLRR